MKRIEKTRALLYLLLLGMVCLAGNSLWAQEEEESDGQIELITTYASDADREMRMVGLQFIRDDVPGEAATKKFAALLPDLSPEAQVDMIEALADRGDVVARSAVLDMVKSEAEPVRAAALGALGSLGSTDDVPLLAQKASGDSGAEKKAAEESLIRLSGDDVNTALLAEMDKGKPPVRVGLLGILAARNARESLPAVLKSTEDSEASVRLAALEALRILADENDIEKIIKALKGAKDDAECRKAELALLGACSRGQDACAGALIAGLADADVRSRVALVRAIARAGGEKAQETLVARLKDDDETVCDEAVRMLSGWPDPSVVPCLSTIAKDDEVLRHRVLAIRGLVRLACPQEKDKPGNQELLLKVMDLAKRPQEKLLVISALGNVGDAKSLSLVGPAITDPAIGEAAGLAAVMIAERIKDNDKEAARDVLEKVLKNSKNSHARSQAQEVLKSL